MREIRMHTIIQTEQIQEESAMSKLTDRISYLKGMAAGMKLNMEKDANQLMMEMLGVMLKSCRRASLVLVV